MDEERIVAQIDECLPEIMRRLFGGRLISSGVWELTIPQLRALNTVAQGGDCSMGKLARSLGIGLSAATGLVDRLVQQGFLQRDAYPSDRRRVCLTLTKAGRRALEACRRERRRRLRAAMQCLSGEEQGRIAGALARLRRAVETVGLSERGAK